MAFPGFSGSCGGISKNFKPISIENLNPEYLSQNGYYSLNVSYFINNICNLKCKHCYVGYAIKDNALTIKEWEHVFDECIELRALTFGNVGKEPTLNWRETIDLLTYFKEKRKQNPRLRFGLVTNALLLNRERSSELCEINPSYLDISIDGNEKIHDTIRGRGTYSEIMANIKSFPPHLLNKVFISFTANRLNLHTIPELIDDVYEIGVKNILISPYVSTNVKGNIDKDNLYAKDEDIITEIKRMLNGELINFNHYDNLSIYVKNDYTVSLSLMKKLVRERIIKKHSLNVDDYGAIFSKYVFNGITIYFNYIPWDNSFMPVIRISHDGYVSNCYDMFFDNYQERTIGNVRDKSITEILENRNVLKKEYAGCDLS
ncbi:MAG: radical SAM protein [Candidatus Firestonebacteria bacterium]